MEIGPILRAQLRNKMRLFLVAVQIAVTLAIVANCVTLVVDARRKMAIPSGVDDESLVLGIISIPTPKLRDDDTQREVWFQGFLEDVRRISGVQAVSASTIGVWLGTGANDIRAANTQDEWLTTATPAVDEFFPDTSGVVIEEGRWFTHDEVQQATRLRYARKNDERARFDNGRVREPMMRDVVISRALGRRLFGEGPLLGRILEDRDGDTARIIGVVRDIYLAGLRQYHSEYHALYRPGAGHSYEYGARFYARAEPGKAAELTRRINDYVRTRYDLGDDSAWPVAEWRNTHFGHQRMLVALMGLLVVLLLFVAFLSTAGLTSFAVTERTRHIGIRRALGATTNDILQYFLTETAIVTTLGLVMGSGLAVLLNVCILRIYDSAKLSSPIILGCAILLAFVALVAALPPAVRATRISPAMATRNV